MARGHVLRCWIRRHELIRERDPDGVWSFVCQICRYRTPIVARTADERDAMARRFPRPGPAREGVNDAEKGTLGPPAADDRLSRMSRRGA